MKKKLLLVAMAVLCLLPKLITAQSNEANLKKYWENRDRLRKYFLKIGPNQGESIPANIRDRNMNNMRWSDATSQLGWYIAVLATEYELLKRDGLSTQATLNELYYAINAIKRLDRDGEFQYSSKLLSNPNVGVMENGWFIRDDVDSMFKQNWGTMGINQIHSDYFNKDAAPIPEAPNSESFQAGNEPSIDQMVALLMGFKFVQKFVGNVFVQPPNEPTGLNMLNEVVAITKRMRDRLLLHKITLPNDFDPTNEEVIGNARNYCFTNPLTDQALTGGHDMWIFVLGYPLMTVIESITGESKDYTFRYTNVDNVEISLSFEKLHDFYDNVIMGHNDCLIDGVFQVFCWADWDVTSTNYAMNMRMILMLEAIGQMSNINYISNYSDERNLPIYKLMHEVMKHYPYGPPGYASTYFTNNSMASHTEFFSMLNEMPPCDGCFIYTENEDPLNPTKSGNGGNFWSWDNRWMKNEAANHDWSNVWIVGNQPGLDYMITYNLFHLMFGNYYDLPTYDPEVACPCASNKFHEISNVTNNSTWGALGLSELILPNISTLTNSKVVGQYDFDSKEHGINFERYLNKNLIIQGGSGHLALHEDVKVCNNVNVELVLTNAKIQVGKDLENPAVLRFTNGTKLIIKSGTILEVLANSKVIIEKGAHIQIHPNARIELKGTNSVLEIRGTLELLPNTIFQTIGEGYVLFNIPKVHSNPNIIVNGNNCQMIFEDATGTRPKRLAIGAGTILFPPSHLNLFKIEGVRVEMLGQVSGIKLGCPLHLVNNDVAGTNSDGITVYHLPHTYYITGNNFSYHNRALTFTGYASLFDIKIRYNQFSNCVNSIILYQQPAHIGGNYFDNSGGVLAGGAVASAGPIKAGLYRGPLRVELNRFQNSSAVSVNGSSFPTVNLMGNVCNWTSTSPFGKGWGYGGDRATSTLTCNYFENQADAITVNSGGELNLSTNRTSNIPTITGGNITGGNNYFKNSQRSIALYSKGGDALSNVFYYLNNGYNSFDANPALHGSSLNIDRQQNYLGLNHTLDINGNVVLNNNYFTPLLGHYNYSSPPVNTIEKNGQPGYHFKVLEFGANTPFYIVGTMHSPNHTCPVSYWNDAVANPTSFDPMTVGSFGTNKRNQERPFASDGVTTATVPSGTYMGQNMGTAFNNAVGGVSAPATDPEEGAVLRPIPQGLLNLANLLASTASCTDVAGMSIYKDGYSIYLKTLADAYALNVFEGNTTLENNQITAALAVFTAIDAHNLQFQSTQPNRFYETKLNTRIDKVHVYRAFKRFDDALTVVSDLLSFANSTDQPSVMFLNCYIENEKQLKNNVINWLEFEEYTTNCGALYNQSWPTYTDSTGGGDTSQQGGGTSEPFVTYTLAPNPATDIITVDMDLNIDGNVKIAVFNKFGIKVVNDIPLGELLAGNHTHTVTIAGLPVDVYNMVVYVDNVPFVKHFIKQSE